MHFPQDSPSPELIPGTTASVLCDSPPPPPSRRSPKAPTAVTAGQAEATINLLSDGHLRTYHLKTTAVLRDHQPADQQITFSEVPGHATIRTGNVLFDGLYAMTIKEARANSVSRISDDAYAGGMPIQIEAFQTGELWKYVWTRDLSYALDLGLAGFDPARAVNSLLFKASVAKASVKGGINHQIVQDTGSGGSYPVSTDRVVWAMGAHATLKYLPAPDRRAFLLKIYPTLLGTIEQDRRLVFDPGDGLYRGEQSFLDWREQTYPGWTKGNVLAVAMSKALSVNAANYILLTHAAGYARLLGQSNEQTRYERWASELRDAVNQRFWDPKNGLYSTYLLSEDGVSDSVPVARYDLLGVSLAILSGLADERQATAIVENYPTGPFGPPVVWPQEKTVPIYHNQGIWPFVTAYWIKAARQVGHTAAVDAGIHSLAQLASLNLSHMENFDFVTGQAHEDSGPRQGPQVNSRRQLWSVAGYFSMVHDVVFGRETSWEGIRFRPYITANLRNDIFRATDTIDWRDFAFQGTQNHIRVQLPPRGAFTHGACIVERVELNGKMIDTDFVKAGDLQPVNEWHVVLKAPALPSPLAPLRIVDVVDERTIFGPVQPRWKERMQGGITLEGNHLSLNYEHDDPTNVSFDIYRDGQRCAEGIRQTKWADPESGNYRDTVHSYRVAAVDMKSGSVSHLTPSRSYRMPDQEQVIPARVMHGPGAKLVAGHHFERWGEPDEELVTTPFTVTRRGRYLVRAEFANGAGPIHTGIACAVKRLEVRRIGAGETVAAGYLVMPQSGDWKRYDLSSAVKAELQPGDRYTLRVSEDEYCRNMSYLKSNERYTASAGGGERSYNQINFAALHLLYLAAK